jgi:alpha-beta hydrolase superfamily lysophospholipase
LFPVKGAKLFLRRWPPSQQNGSSEAGESRAILHIVHGMCEHTERYDAFARAMADFGFEVWAADMRGHGRTADFDVNAPSEGGLLGHCADKKVVDKVLADIDAINQKIIDENPGKPLFLLGHSWGSFLVQGYVERFQRPLSGCILTGTRGPTRLLTGVGTLFFSILCRTLGVRRRLVSFFTIGMRVFNRSFKPFRTPFDWENRDTAEVDTLLTDPLAGRPPSLGFYRDLCRLLFKIHAKHGVKKIRHDLPVYIVSGSADPVGRMGDGPTALVRIYRSIGIQDLEFVLYPDARHEILFETNKKEVIENLAAWMTAHIPT